MNEEQFIEEIKKIKIDVPDEEFFLEYNKVIFNIINDKERLHRDNGALQQVHEYDVKMIDDVKGKYVELYKEKKQLQQERDKYKSIVEEIREYVENEIPCLWEVDEVWEDIDGNYCHNYKEYDSDILLEIVRGEENE